MRKRRLVYGVGINDADYTVKPVINGNKVRCHYYESWSRMLRRCYDQKYHSTHPTYKGCSVTDEWLSFMDFKKWMEKQYWNGKHLDKDLLISSNKVYSPESCIFVSQAVNNLFNDHNAKRGKYAQGVCLNKQHNKFQANCKVNGKQKNLGYYATEKEASEAYKAFKLKHCLEIANQQTNERLKQAIIRKANLLLA